MKDIYLTYLNILQTAPEADTASVSLSEDDLSVLASLAQKHCTVPFVLPYLRRTAAYPALKTQAKEMLLQYYQMEHFTRLTTELLKNHDIECYLLKGLSLADCYPVPEYRKLGDLDLYLRDPSQLSRAQAILTGSGYQLENEISDHHQTYHYSFPETGRRFLLELHYRVIGQYQYEPANRLVDEVFSPANIQPVRQTILGYTYTVLPPTAYVFYMLHHMLKHYLYGGFGVRLLCDFTRYLNRYYTDIDFAQLHNWCQTSRISNLYRIVLTSCREYLGLLPVIDPDIHYPEKDCQDFLLQVLADADMGSDVSRALVASGSYQKINLLTYFKEGHVQMKVRFPRASRVPVLWPVLWAVTLFCFLRNNHIERGSSLKQVLRDFREKNEKTQLIRIFENSDS